MIGSWSKLDCCHPSRIEVVKKTPKRVKHVPQRTCVGCRKVIAKRALVRIVRTSEGLRIDPTGKAAGRGAYLHAQRSCWERGLKGALAHALKIDLTDQDRETLRAFMAGLPDEPAPSEEMQMPEARTAGLEREEVDQPQ